MKRKLCFVFSLMILIGGSVRSQTTLEWWQFWTDPTVKPTIEAMVAEFEEANPDIDVRLTDLTWANGHEKIVIALASGTGPDILELGSDWIAQFADADQLVAISSHIAEDSAGFQGWSLATYGGGVYARPWILGTRILFVNGDVVGRTIFPPDFQPLRWSHNLIFADSLCRLGGDLYAWGSNAPEKHRLYKKFLPLFWTARGQIFTDDGRYCVISSLYAIQALEIYKEMHEKCAYVADQRGIEDAFLNGKVAMIISGDWLLKRIRLEKPGLNFTTTLLPDIWNNPPITGTSFLGGEFLAVNEATENREAALRFVDFITSPESQIRFCKASGMACPSSRVAQEDEHFQSDPHLQTFIRQANHAKHPPVDPDWVYIEDIIEEAVEAAVFGDKTAAEALREAQLKITEIKKER
jgi:multiple sugar transport system substrate-binding protein